MPGEASPGPKGLQTISAGNSPVPPQEPAPFQASGPQATWLPPSGWSRCRTGGGSRADSPERTRLRPPPRSSPGTPQGPRETCGAALSAHQGRASGRPLPRGEGSPPLWETFGRWGSLPSSEDWETAILPGKERGFPFLPRVRSAHTPKRVRTTRLRTFPPRLAGESSSERGAPPEAQECDRGDGSHRNVGRSDACEEGHSKNPTRQTKEPQRGGGRSDKGCKLAVCVGEGTKGPVCYAQSQAILLSPGNACHPNGIVVEITSFK